MLFVYHSGCNPWIVTVTELLFTNHQHKPFVMQKKVLFVLSKSTSNYTLKVLSSEVINLIVTPPGLEPRIPAWEAGVLSRLTTGPHARLILSCSRQTRFFLIACLLSALPLQWFSTELLEYFLSWLQSMSAFNSNSPSIGTPYADLVRSGGNRTPSIFCCNSTSIFVSGRTAISL